MVACPQKLQTQLKRATATLTVVLHLFQFTVYDSILHVVVVAVVVIAIVVVVVAL